MVVITGCGWMTPLSAGSIDEVLRAARELGTGGGTKEVVKPAHSAPSVGRAIWAIPDERVSDYPSLSKELQRDKGAWMTAAALEHACADAAIVVASVDSTRVGLVLGCGLAGQIGMISFANEVRQQSARFVSPIHFPQTVGNYIAGALARGCDIRGPNVTLASGPASGLDALVEACGLLANGQADVVLAGGTEPLIAELADGFSETDIPLSEGACLFVLESASHAAGRGARPLAAVKNWRYTQASSGEDETHAGMGQAAKPRDGATSIVSVAGTREIGAICIEHWIGRCIGAWGAAAVAAAIGAAGQHTVPVVESSRPASVSVRSFAVEEIRGEDGTVSASVIADADGGHRTVLELQIPQQD